MTRIRLRNSPPVSLESVDVYRQILSRTHIVDGATIPHTTGSFSGTTTVTGTFTNLPLISDRTYGRSIEVLLDTSSGGQVEVVISGGVVPAGQTSLSEIPAVETIYCFGSESQIVSGYWSYIDQIVITGTATDSSYGIGAIQINERYPLRTGENLAPGKSVQSYRNGEFVLVTTGTDNEYELNTGAWLVDYVTPINIPTGNKGYVWIGSDGGDFGWDGLVESPFFALGAYSDVRTGETSTARNFTALHQSTEAPQPDEDSTLHISTNGEITQVQELYMGWESQFRPAESINSDFGTAVAIEGSPMLLGDARQFMSSTTGSVEFVWSPAFDMGFDLNEERYVFDAASTESVEVTSITPITAILPNRVTDISRVYRAGDLNRTPLAYTLKPDGKTIVLRERLPSTRSDLVVECTPIDYSGDRLSLTVDGYNTLTYRIDSGDKYIAISRQVEFQRNTWHRIIMQWNVSNSGLAAIRLFVDGDENNSIVWGSPDMVWGEFAWGQNQTATGNNTVSGILRSGGLDEFSTVAFGGTTLGTNVCPMRLDNCRFSSAAREMTKIGATFYDLNWNAETDRMLPVVSDATTTLILDFERNTDINSAQTLAMYQTSPLYTVQVDIDDGFSRVVTDQKSAELLRKMYDRLKPAHIRLNSRYKQEIE